MKPFGDIYACRWRAGNQVPVAELIHGHAGKGEARFLREQALYGRTARNVDGRGVDHVVEHSGVEIKHELKYVQRNRRIRTGDAGAQFSIPLFKLADSAIEIVCRVMGETAADADDEFRERFEKTVLEFNRRRVSQGSWRNLFEYVEIAGALMTVEELHIESRHPWFLDVEQGRVDMHSLSPLGLLANSDVLVLVRDQDYTIIPRSKYEEYLAFKGEVSPVADPNLSVVAFPDADHILTDDDDIFHYTEALYEYVVRYKSSSTDPDTGKKRKNRHGNDTRTAA